MRSSKVFNPLFFLLPVLFLLMPGRALAERQSALAENAVTGDTLRLKGGKTLRYIGVEAYPLQSKVPLAREYGERAKAFNDSLVAGKTIQIEWDSKLRDDRNNLLAYVFLEDGTFVNLEVVRSGHAKARIRVPNTRYAAQLREGENEARRERKGLWENEPVDPLANKTYIGEKNTKIYYRPDSPELDRIPEAQWIYFDSRVSAKAAGYRPCSTCRDASSAEFEA